MCSWARITSVTLFTVQLLFGGCARVQYYSGENEDDLTSGDAQVILLDASTTLSGDGLSGDDGGVVGTSEIQLTRLSLGNQHGCALFTDGRLKCFGDASSGALGSGDTNNRGDNPGEMGAALPFVDYGSLDAKQIAVAFWGRTCVVLSNGLLKCWGSGPFGRLGSGDEADRGNDPGEMGGSLPAISLGTGQTVDRVAIGHRHTCALLESAGIKCWANNAYGQLGKVTAGNIGDEPNEMGDNLPLVDLGTGGVPTWIDAGEWHTCALFDTGQVKCWGRNHYGRLGLGDEDHRGDEDGEMGDNLPFVDLGTGRSVKMLAVGSFHNCAILDNDRVTCWGDNRSGQLGLSTTEDAIGDESGEMGDNLLFVDLGTALRPLWIGAGTRHTCVLFENGAVKCWGDNSSGQLGQNDMLDRGQSTMGTSLPFVDFGAGLSVQRLEVGGNHNCAILTDETIRCWGSNEMGQLGIGSTTNQGDQSSQMQSLAETQLY